MNNQDFIDICRFIYGVAWQNKAAIILDINIRTIQYWSSGKKKVPYEIAENILATAADKIIGIESRLGK